MANRTIFTNFFRAFYPHLDAPYAHKPTQPAKYGISMAFPKSGKLPAHIGDGSTDVSIIMQALNEVCVEEWGVDFANAVQVRSVQFPPEWKDGDTDWKKDDKDNKLIGQPKDASVGMWILSAKNTSPVGTCDHTGQNDIDPKQIYSGAWCRAQLEVSAYTNKEKTSIIVITLVNVQKCYDDANLGGGGTPVQAATQAFAGMAVTNSNCQVTGVGFTGTPTAPSMPGMTAPVAPSVPAAPALPTYEMTSAANGHTREQLIIQGWSDALLLQHGLMVETSPKSIPALPALPTLPVNVTAPQTVASPSNTAPVMPGAAYLKPPVMPGM